MLATCEGPSNWVRTKPKSDFSIVSTGHSCPLMLCEVMSESNENDRWSMLIQAIAAARVGYYLNGSQQSPQHEPFFVVAIYIRVNLTAERYIVMQTNPDGEV